MYTGNNLTVSLRVHAWYVPARSGESAHCACERVHFTCSTITIKNNAKISASRTTSLLTLRKTTKTVAIVTLGHKIVDRRNLTTSRNFMALLVLPCIKTPSNTFLSLLEVVSLAIRIFTRVKYSARENTYGKRDYRLDYRLG